MDDLIGNQSHYVSLPSQSNVHLSAIFRKVDGSVKIFVASLKKKIYLIEYEYFDNYIEPVTKELYFAYISVGFEIISLDVFNRSQQINDLVIGIVIMKKFEGGNSTHLNIYSEYNMETKTDFNLEMIGQSCESFVLDYIPYGLYHVEISPHQINGSYENIWIIPGNDNKVHSYRGYHSERCHREIPVTEFFVEFNDTCSIILSLNVLYYNDYHNRISCLGCENGVVCCTIVDCKNNSILRNLHAEYENPVSSIQLFSLRMSTSYPDKMVQMADEFLRDQNPEINLLVTNTLYHSEVFMDVLNSDFKRRHCLTESAEFDVCLCSLVADVDFDGNKEIIIGTYSEALLIFKYTDDKTWQYIGKKELVPNPIYSLYYEDMTEDGLSEFIIVTSKGLHIYQHALKQDILEELHRRIKNLLKSKS